LSAAGDGFGDVFVVVPRDLAEDAAAFVAEEDAEAFAEAAGGPDGPLEVQHVVVVADRGVAAQMVADEARRWSE
jgi:hypothetical protein